MNLALLRIVTIARCTLTEALRQKVLNVLILFAVITIGCVPVFGSFTFEEQLKFLKDSAFGAITVFGLLIALISTAQMIPAELENRTIYTILAKPVRRSEFLLGKYLGVLSLLAVTVLLMSLVFAVVLFYQEQALKSDVIRSYQAAHNPDPRMQEMLNQDLFKITQKAHDSRLVQGILLIYAKLSVVAALALLVSTFATSAVFTVSTTFMLYLIGHLESIAREEWLTRVTNPDAAKTIFLGTLSFLIPDLNAYNVIDDIVAGNIVKWSLTFNLLGYTLVYIFVVILVAQVLFNEREL